MKKIKTLFILTAASLLLAGCQKSPETPIVQNKDLDNMVSEASGDGTDSKKADAVIQETAENYESYVKDISDETFKVNVKVNAQVEVPEVDKLSVVRVKQKELDDEFLAKFLSVCEPDTVFTSDRIYNRSECEDNISQIRSQINDVENGNTDISDEEKQTVIEDLQKNIDSWQSIYENAPEEVTAEDVEAKKEDTKLVSVADKLSDNPDDDFYQWESELGTSRLFYGSNSGVGGRYVSVYLQNNADYGNLFRYRVSNTDEIYVKSVVASGLEGHGKTKQELDSYMDGASGFSELTGEADATISLEDAKSKAQELIDELGLTDFACSDADLYYEVPEFRDTAATQGYRKVYVIQYLRQFDGVFVDNNSGDMMVDDWSGDDYVKKVWSGENVRVYVNDGGIVGFDYEIPLELMETVVEDSSIKSFDDIKKTFESMIVANYASDTSSDDDTNLSTNVTVDKVVLRYTRVSEQDSFSTGLMVPVWDFIGSVSYEGDASKLEAEKNSVVLTINAIDGTIIDRTVGY